MDGADSPKPLLVTVGLFLIFLVCVVVMFAHRFWPTQGVTKEKKPRIEKEQVAPKERPGV